MSSESPFVHAWEQVKNKKNVVGYSGFFKKRIKKGQEVVGTKVMRIYVSKKESLEKLSPNDRIPKTIDDVETDVVEVGEVKAQKNANAAP